MPNDIRPPSASAGTGPADMLQVVLHGNEFAVRDTLQKATNWLQRNHIARNDQAQIESVLAEILNNIVEHAYAGQDDGLIEFTARIGNGRISILITDAGLPVPEQVLLPQPVSQPHLNALEDLPEGGWGWMMIRAMSDSLRYRRLRGKNHLSLSVPLSAQEK